MTLKLTNGILKILFFVCICRPILLLVLGLNVRHRHRLPRNGPAVLVANHNSHLDTVVLMCLFPLSALPCLRPVGAADYFFKGRWLTWFSTQIMGIIPLNRCCGGGATTVAADLLAPVSRAINDQSIIIYFPEGTRGEPERMARFRSGISHLAMRHPEVPIYPIFLHGLGKALPRGDFLIVPFFCDVVIGEPVPRGGTRSEFTSRVEQEVIRLGCEVDRPAWD